MKKIRRWFRRNKKEIVRTYVIIVTAVAIFLSVTTIRNIKTIEDNNLEEYFYTCDLPAEEF